MYKRRWYTRRWTPYYFDSVYSDLLYKMNMFKSFLESIPKNRSDFVNNLEIPEDVLKPYVFTDFEESVLSSDSLVSSVVDDFELKPRSAISTDSSISLSRAMTDSEIDYEMFRRLKNRSTDPFDDLRTAVEAFPPDYLESLQSYHTSAPEITPYKHERLLYNEELERRMKRFIEEECQVFDPEDPTLLDLEEALENLDMKALEADLARIKSCCK